MNMLTSRDPFTRLPAFDRLFSTLLAEPLSAGAVMSDEGTLALDLSEDDTHVIVRASVPGFSREQIHVEVHEGVLTIKAESSEQTEEQTERFYRRERRTGSLSRRVSLPSIVEEGDASAELNDGVLTLRLPKQVKATPRRITIK